MRMRSGIALSALVLGVMGVNAQATVHTWDSVDLQEFTNGAYWTNGAPSMPSPATDDIIINTGISQFSPGGDFRLDGALTVNAGATFQQLPGNGSWMKIGDATNSTPTLTINGTFKGPTTGRLWFGYGSGSVATVNVNAGGSLVNQSDLIIQNGSTLTVSGTSATATISGNTELNGSGTTLWANSGGSISMQNLVMSSGTTVKVSDGGAISRTGNMAMGAGLSLNVSGAGSSMTIVNGELKPEGGSVSVSGGTVKADLISFDGAANTLELSGGLIYINKGNFFNGIFSVGGERYVNYTLDSTGVMFFKDGTTATADNLINGNTLRYNGLTGLSYFNVYEADGGVYVGLVPTPEPTSIALAGIGGLIALRRPRRFKAV